MTEKRVCKTVLWAALLMAVVSSCSQTAISDNREVMSVAVDEEVMWEDLKIQKFLPGYMARPAIEPYLPAHFVALPHPESSSEVCWGDKENLEIFFEKGASHLKSAIISVDISLGIAQINENSLSDIGSDSDLASEGIKNCIQNKRKWGTHPVTSLDAMMDDYEIHLAWIGLDYNGQVLCASLVYPHDQKAPSAEDLNIWSEFLKKTKPLRGHAFYKAHGQDLRKGLTLMNVYGSVLKISAEKRKRDGRIQVIIKPVDDRISCKCLNVAEMIMGEIWHFSEPVLKISSEIHVSSDANIVSHDTITVLLKEVSEFSDVEKGSSSNSLTRNDYSNISVFNFCKKSLLMKAGVLQH